MGLAVAQNTNVSEGAQNVIYNLMNTSMVWVLLDAEIILVYLKPKNLFVLKIDLFLSG